MSDSPPPNGGPGPYHGWDPDGLLSGENVWIPEGMREVARTLAALRAAPASAELAGEATARAVFRQLMPAGESGSSRSGAESGDADTLILATPAVDGGPHRVTRPRHSHRRPPSRGHWRSRALVGAAAAAVVIAGAVMAGPFSGSGGQQGSLGFSPRATNGDARPGGSGSNRVEGTAAKEPAARPTPSSAGGQPAATGPGAESGPDALCRQYLAFVSRPESYADWAAQRNDLQQLTSLAGGPGRVARYCMKLQRAAAPPEPGSDPGRQGSSPHGDSRNAQGNNPLDSPGRNWPVQHAGNGNGNQNGHGGPGPGFRGQSRH